MATSPTKVVTGKCRISFPNLFVPVPQRDDNGDVIEGSAKKYSVMLLIPKDDTATLRKLRKAQEAALESGKSKFGGKIPRTWKDTLHDCDDEDDLEKYPEREGHWRISVSANEQYKPGVVDQQLNAILDATEVYSGCYARASLNAYAYKHPKSGPGVSFGLNNLQKMGDGEPLGAVAAKPEDDFDEVDDDDLI